MRIGDAYKVQSFIYGRSEMEGKILGLLKKDFFQSFVCLFYVYWA